MSTENMVQLPEQTLTQVRTLVKRPLVYENEPVVTLLAVDGLHAREPGSTIKHFERYRDGALKKGIHYLEAPYVVWSQWVTETPSEGSSGLPTLAKSGGGFKGPLTLLTERGYLRLIMYFEDELSKNICEYVLDSYFAVKNKQVNIQNNLNTMAMEMAAQTLDTLDQKAQLIVDGQRNTLKVLMEMHKEVLGGLESLPVRIANANRTVRKAEQGAPNLYRGGLLIPETFRSPVGLAYSECRPYTNEACVWLMKRWGMSPRDAYNILYINLSNRLDFHIRNNCKSYTKQYGGSCISMIEEKGYARECAEMAFSLWGNGQRPEQIPDTHANPHVDLTPVGPRTGMTYTSYLAVGRTRKGHRRVANAVVDQVSATAQAAVEENRKNRAVPDLFDSAEDRLANLPTGDKKEVSQPEPFLQAQR